MTSRILAAAVAAVTLGLGSGNVWATVVVGPQTPSYTGMTAAIPGGGTVDLEVGLSSNASGGSSVSFGNGGTTVNVNSGASGTFFDLSVRTVNSGDTASFAWIGTSVPTPGSPLFNQGTFDIGVTAPKGTFTFEVTITGTPTEITDFTTPEDGGLGGFDVDYDYLQDPPSTVSFDVLDPNGTPLSFTPATAVPEPSGLALFGVSLYGLMALRRRRAA
jgi:hypothetical protein